MLAAAVEAERLNVISDETLTALRWFVWIATVLAAFMGSWFAFRKEKGLAEFAWAGILVAVFASLATIADTKISDEQDSRDRKGRAKEILEEIEGVQASGDVVVDGEVPGLGAYRSRLVDSRCLSLGDRQGDAVFIGEKDCLPVPDSDREQAAFDRLGSVVLKLDVFGRPPGYVGCGYEGLEGASPDFSVRISASLPESTLRLAYNRYRGEFILRTGVLEKPREKFNIRNGDVLTAGNLEGARLLVRLQSFSSAGGEESDWLRTKLENFQIQFKSSSPVVARPGWIQVGTAPPVYLVCLERKDQL